jgi:glycosyltransferase involved in cell wall biosynthesis
MITRRIQFYTIHLLSGRLILELKETHERYYRALQEVFIAAQGKLKPIYGRGLPVITTATGDSEIIKGVEFVVSHGDINGLASALEKLMSDDALRAKLGEYAIKRARELTRKKVAEKIAALLESL